MGKALLTPPPQPHWFSHLDRFERSDQTCSTGCVPAAPNCIRVPPTATAHCEVEGKDTSSGPYVRSPYAPQSPVATNTVIRSACVRMRRFWPTACIVACDMKPSEPPRLMLTALPGRVLSFLLLLLCCCVLLFVVFVFVLVLV